MNRRDKGRNSVVDYLLSSRLLETCVDYQLKRFPSHHLNREDIIQDAWVWVLSYDEDKLIDAYENNHLNALITRYLQNQIYSTTSEYYRRYVRFDETTDEITQKHKDTIADD